MRPSFPFACLASLALACSEKQAPAASTGVEVKTVDVTDRGYEPARIEVKGGEPVTLRFIRKTAETCGESVLIDGDPVAHRLPLGRAIDVQVLAPRTGEIAFVCGMHMMRGVLVAR